MAKGKEVSIEKRCEIIRKYNDESMGYRKIAKLLDLNYLTVRAIVKKYKKDRTVYNKPRSGRPRCTSKRQDQVVARVALNSPLRSKESIKIDLINNHDINVSKRTIGRSLRDYGIKSYCVRKKPLLTKAHAQKRLKWAKFMRSSGIDFKDIVFSDETKISLTGSDGRAYVNRRKNDNPFKFVNPTTKKGVSVMVWGFITFSGQGKVCIIEGTLNGPGYIKLLQENLLPYINYDSKFQDDNAPCHRSKEVLNWIDSIGLDTINWPAQSPDLNIIENLWHVLKVKIHEKQPKNIKDLKECIYLCWDDIMKSKFV